MKTRLLSLLAVWTCIAGVVGAADWPQWQGPDRTNVSKEASFLKAWPKGGPKLLWTYEKAGIGYSCPAIVGDRLYLMGTRDGNEIVFALNAKTGDEIWVAEVGKLFTNGYGDGPRGTPTVDGDYVYGLGGQGAIVCVKADKGDVVWRKSMDKDLGGKVMSGWGYSESVLIDGDKLICSPGGKQGTLAALDKKTGNVLWRSADTTDEAAYSSVIVAEVGKVKQYVQLTGKGIVGVNAADGKQLWYYAQNGYRTAVIPTPLFADSHVYATADYGAGCDLLKLSPADQGTKMDKVYANKNMQNHHGGVVLLGDCIYGCSGNGNARTKWVCQKFKDGTVVYEDEKILDAGSLTSINGQLILYGQKDGTVVLAEPMAKAFKENGRFTIPRQTKTPRKQGKIWTHPVVANGHLYLRDQDLLFCYDVSADGK